MKAVIDTNVLVSYLLSPRGAGAWLIALWGDQRFEMVLSEDQFTEITDVLSRKEVATRVDPQRKLALLRRLRYDASWTPGHLDIKGLLPDPDDDFLLSAALETGAAFIVTWDMRLLELGSCRGVQIVTPDQFLSIIVRSRSHPFETGRP